MNFKKVNGITLNQVAQRAFNTAMEKGLDPKYVKQWVEWFGLQPADGAPKDAPEYYMGDIQEFAGDVVERLRDELSVIYADQGSRIPQRVNDALDDAVARVGSVDCVRGLVG